MSIAINPATVAASIAALSISGVTVRDIDEIPQSGQMICPILFPQPDGWMTDIAPEVQSFGSNGTEKMDFSYTLHYVFLHSEAGSGMSQLDPIAPLVEKFKTVIDAILNNDAVSGLVDLRLAGVDAFGRVEDASGTQYWGALFSLRVLEYAQ